MLLIIGFVVEFFSNLLVLLSQKVAVRSVGIS